MNDLLIRAAAAARPAVIVAVLAFVASPSFAGSGRTMRIPTLSESLVSLILVEPLGPEALRPVERAFLEKAAELSGHQGLIAKLAVSQANSSDVRTYAQQLASDHRQIADSIEALRRKRGVSGETTQPEAGAARVQELAQKSGGDFDREFVRLASDLQNDALRLFEEVLANAKDSEVRDLIGTYLPTLRDHQNRGTALRKTHN